MLCDERLTINELNDDERARVEAFQQSSGLLVLEMVRQDDKILPTLINGAEVDRANWLEVVRIGNRSCTGTIVGRNAAITAAHCGRNNSRSVLEVYNAGTTAYRMIHHPRYRGNGPNWDVAVLVLDNDVDLTPATVGIDYTFSNGADVDLLGYGCTRPGGGGGNDGILRFGESKVTGFTGTDVITSWRPSGGALCFGDSGGPMFADGSNAGGQRKLIAVNSKGNIRDTNYNIRLDLPDVRSWLESVAQQYDLEIIGVNSQPDTPDPGPEPDPGQPGDFSARLAADYRNIAAHYESMAEEHENAGSNNNGGGSCDENSSGTFGL